MKKRKLLLNLSLIFGAAYHALFLVGYFLQKPLFAESLLLLPPYTVEQLKPTYFVPVIVVTALSGVGFAVMDLWLKKNTSKGAFIGAAVFSGVAFIAERLVNFFAPTAGALNGSAANGELGVISFSLSRLAINFLDAVLLPLFVAAIVLMCCAACINNSRD